MTLRRSLALRYSAVVAICLALLAGMIHHEFYVEPRQRQALGIPELPETVLGEWGEVFFYAMIPVVLGGGWWLMRRTLAPIDSLARSIENIQTHHLHERLPRALDGGEIDRLSQSFNQMLTRLEQSFQQIRQFTLHASHELKTPLTVMHAQLQTLLEDEASLSCDQREWLQCHRREWLECQLNEVQRLTRIVDALILLTKADIGLVALKRAPLELDQLVRESFEDAQILAEASEIQVTLGPCDQAVIVGDRDRLRQLLLNLTDNAVKYNRPGGSVAISLRRRDGLAEVEITNTGEGIPPELQERVFERFVRGDEARSRAIEGCGLGLPFCRWIAQAHQGTLELSSTPGDKTTLLARFPLAHSKSENAS